MSDGSAIMLHKIASASDLQAVVRTMKSLAASSVGQYEKSVAALADYYRTVELGLGACVRQSTPVLPAPKQRQREQGSLGAVVFGSDQGLVGQFNEVLATYVTQTLSALPGKPQVWAVGEHIHARLVDAGLNVVGLLPVPVSVGAIAQLVGRIQIECEAGKYQRLYIFHNRPLSSASYEQASKRLLPLDLRWQRRVAAIPWPTHTTPQIIGGVTRTIAELIREYLFITLFRACAESLAAENASRLAAMQRADKNIDALLETLRTDAHKLRQQSIDEELFDVIAGYDALAKDHQ